jgi:hypothetical protein
VAADTVESIVSFEDVETGLATDEDGRIHVYSHGDLQLRLRDAVLPRPKVVSAVGSSWGV